MEKGCLHKNKRLGLFKKHGNSINPIQFTVQDSGYIYFLCEAKNSNTDQKSWVKTNKQTNKQTNKTKQKEK